jgi:hypothetical protein
MLLQIIEGTPIGVWFLFAGLVGLGLAQARPRSIGAARAMLMPAAFVVLSLAGVISAFGAQRPALAAWGSGIVASLAVGPRLLPRLRATWEAAGDTLHVGGSWLPLALIVALFAVKYAAGVSLAMHPSLAGDGEFAAACGLAYGAFSGLFAARGLQLLRIRQAARA